MSNRWDRITALFDAARALDPAARSAFLEVACDGDTDQRTEVEALLASDAAAGEFLVEPIAPELESSLREARALQSGQILKNRYRVDELFSMGGHALVYKAIDELLGRPVVIKVLRAEGRCNGLMRARLHEEMQALARIDHPGVVGILDTGELEDGSPFLAIQYIDGMSLREALKTGHLEPLRIAAILRQIGTALRATHAIGIAHRDLKPENIMLQRLADGSETVKLIDFGIAKIERSELQPEMTTVMVAGTVRYMAPEQFEGKNSPESDIYSLGLVTCEMLCGQPDIRALPESIRRGTRRMLEAALAFRLKDRPKDVRRWADGLAASISESRGYGRRAAIAAGACVILTASCWLSVRSFSKDDDARVIEKVGAFDPVSEGFQIHNDLYGTVAENADKTEYDGWRIFTSRQGHYYRHLSNAQKKRALQRGWKLTAVIRAEEGQSTVGVDFAGYGKRFDISVIARPGADLVRLPTQTVPSRQGIDIEIPSQVPSYRRYELNYDASLGVATLWVDGKKLLGGYRGWTQFQDDFGLLFGTTVLGSGRGVGTFQSVRFEINP